MGKCKICGSDMSSVSCNPIKYGQTSDERACLTCLRKAVDGYAKLRAENERLRAELADTRELPTIAAMWAHHNRDDEVRELRALCDRLCNGYAQLLGAKSEQVREHAMAMMTEYESFNKPRNKSKCVRDSRIENEVPHDQD